MKRRIKKRLPVDLEQSVTQMSHRERSRLGGLACARRYGKEFAERRSSLGGQACLAKYGPDFYRHINARGRQKRGDA